MFDPVAYALHYGGRCRECADADGVCPTSGMPCDTTEAAKAAQHCLKAWQYGIQHGHIENPFAPAPETNVSGLQYRPNEFDDWGVIRDADGKVFASVRRPAWEEELAEHRRTGTDPYEDLARRLISTFDTPPQDRNRGGADE